jgi:hypothetical protein
MERINETLVQRINEIRSDYQSEISDAVAPHATTRVEAQRPPMNDWFEQFKVSTRVKDKTPMVSYHFDTNRFTKGKKRFFDFLNFNRIFA